MSMELLAGRYLARPEGYYSVSDAAHAQIEHLEDVLYALPHIAFTVPYNMSEQPAASINWTASRDGLPIGVQIIGRRFDDAGVLRLARLVEQLRPAQRAWPEP